MKRAWQAVIQKDLHINVVWLDIIAFKLIFALLIWLNLFVVLGCCWMLDVECWPQLDVIH